MHFHGMQRKTRVRTIHAEQTDSWGAGAWERRERELIENAVGCSVPHGTSRSNNPIKHAQVDADIVHPNSSMVLRSPELSERGRVVRPQNTGTQLH